MLGNFSKSTGNVKIWKFGARLDGPLVRALDFEKIWLFASLSSILRCWISLGQNFEMLEKCKFLYGVWEILNYWELLGPRPKRKKGQYFRSRLESGVGTSLFARGWPAEYLESCSPSSRCTPREIHLFQELGHGKFRIYKMLIPKAQNEVRPKSEETQNQNSGPRKFRTFSLETAVVPLCLPVAGVPCFRVCVPMCSVCLCLLWLRSFVGGRDLYQQFVRLFAMGIFRECRCTLQDVASFQSRSP